MNFSIGPSRVTCLRRSTNVAVAALAWLMGMVAADASQGLGLAPDIVTEMPSAGGFPPGQHGQAAALCLAGAGGLGVLCAAADLPADIERVTGIKPALGQRVSVAIR